MAKATGGNGQPKSKMAGVRQILAVNPTATGSEISKLMKSQFRMSMNPKVAGTYRYHIQKAARRNQRKAVRAVAGAQGLPGKTDGLDFLLRAAEKLGWKRVKEIVDGVLSAPK